MMEFFNIMGNKIWNVWDVVILNGASITYSAKTLVLDQDMAISVWLSQMEGVLSLSALILTISYTAWKWRKDYRKGKKEKTENESN